MHLDLKIITFVIMSTLIEKQISHLLHYHDCVIVPGLGGFVANYKSAVIHPEQNLFVPPLKEIGFNRSLLHQDGLLANCIAMQQNISFAEASVLIADFVSDVRSCIAGGETVNIGEVGSLRGDAIGNILFSPNENASFLPDALGLSSFRFEPLDYKHVAKIEQKLHVPQIMQNRSSGYWTAVAAMIAVLFIISTFELKMPEVGEAGFSSFLTSSSIEIIDDNVEEITSKANTEIEQDDYFHDGLEVEVQEVAVGKSHHVIAASFNNEVSAKRAVISFIKEGYSNAKLLESNSGRFRIALESFASRQEAIKSMNELRKQSRFASVWVHTSK